MEGFDISGLVPEYLEDARAHLDALDAALLDMERDMASSTLDVELVSELLGSLHTLKGNSGMMGFGSLQSYVHALEGALKGVLETGAPPSAPLMQALFDAAAALREAIDQVEKDHASPPELAAQEEALKAASEAAGKAEPAEAAPGPKAASGRRPAARGDGFKYIGARTNILKVDFTRLDELLNLAGELVIHRTKLAQVEKDFRERFGDSEALAGELTEASELIAKATADLQEAIMKVRMLPVAQVFQRFPRMVRDLSRERGKEIEISFTGGETELDKTVIDEIGEPLLHLIRNAVDHGIEPPEERTKDRKSPVGEIRLTAAQEGNHIKITVSDDGAGLDMEGIRRKAALFYPKEELGAMGRDNLMDLIFEPGFSTAATVSEVSGRGVGLDVVKRNVGRLGGMVEVHSEPGRGTTFTIKLPLTLAIISSLMVGAGSERYALPLGSVVESLRVTPDDVHTVSGRDVIRLRERVLPIVRLSGLFGSASRDNDGGRMYVVVVGRAEKRVGLVVDRLLGRQEIVIKPLDEYVGEAEGIAGATIMGDGSVVLILDISGLIDRNLVKADKRELVRGGS